MNIEVLRFKHGVYKAAERFHQAQQLYLDAVSDDKPDLSVSFDRREQTLSSSKIEMEFFRKTDGGWLPK